MTAISFAFALFWFERTLGAGLCGARGGRVPEDDQELQLAKIPVYPIDAGYAGPCDLQASTLAIFRFRGPIQYFR
ncbi:hypothetical protein CU048_06505 [Beijerinckiaceae bacterium]|nr:hypothetical protein CU048_06505 [Beijerinckiaceae bacterium]